MCGILGEIHFRSRKNIDGEKFETALSLQAHRGPDSSGMFHGRDFIFGHRRLSIIDLDPHANQPMVSECGNYILVFNGEIYNYLKLKNELSRQGYIFKTSSDTEVLLNAYMEYGIECIDKFVGMFAFALYDGVEDAFYIVRDRLGIKPLYFYKDDIHFFFSSEIKSILKLLKKKPRLNLDAISSYMSFRYPILNDSFFENIHSLAPATFLKIKNGRIETKEYWSPIERFKEQREDRGEEYYKERLKEILEDSVKLRMRSDVPFGAFLSGGVDSSIVAALMATNTNENIKTFTIGFKEEGFNEFKYANLVARRYNTDHHEILLGGDSYIENIQKLISFKDAPLSVPNEVPLYLMSKELKRYITVVLSGEGADEIFGGYGKIFRSPYDYERIKSLDNFDWKLKQKKDLIENFREKYGVYSFDSEIEHFINLYSYTSMGEKKELLGAALDLNGIEQSLRVKFQDIFDQIKNESYTNKIMYAFEKIHLLGLLHRVDTATMAASVEARVPFVDHRLVEFAFTVPLKYKLKWKKERPETLMSDLISEEYDEPKYILKKTFEEMLPKEVLYRKKMGFPVPLNRWFGGEFNDFAKEILLSKVAKSRRLYNTDNIVRWLKSERLSKDHGFAMKIWMLINIELFIRKYID